MEHVQIIFLNTYGTFAFSVISILNLNYCVFLEEYVGNKYKGLATDEDAVDGLKNTKIQLNKRLLDHFRVLAASNKDTDEVT